MSRHDTKTIEILHDLIQINKDSERGYKEASEKVSDPELKTILYRLAQQRALFRGEIEEDLRKDFKDDAEVSDSITSKLHRGWMDFKTMLRGDDAKAVLEECERGEEHAIDAYSKALNGSIPDYIEEKISKQLDLIKGALSQVKEFKSSKNYA